VFGRDEEATPSALADSSTAVTINLFDEVVTPLEAAKAARPPRPGQDDLKEPGEQLAGSCQDGRCG